MNDLNNVPKTGTFGNAVDEINSNFELVETAISQLESRTIKFAGFFQDATALEAAIPSPTVGMWADVGSTKIIYRCNTAGTWTETEETDSISASVSYDVVNNLTSTSTTKALSAKQGKVLKDALDSLKAAGYVFAGVVSPSSSISTPSEKVFYIGGAGTYANFGSIYTVNPGEIGVFSYNGSWSKSKIDTMPAIYVTNAQGEEYYIDNILPNGVYFSSSDFSSQFVLWAGNKTINSVSTPYQMRLYYSNGLRYILQHRFYTNGVWGEWESTEIVDANRQFTGLIDSNGVDGITEEGVYKTADSISSSYILLVDNKTINNEVCPTQLRMYLTDALNINIQYRYKTNGSWTEWVTYKIGDTSLQFTGVIGANQIDSITSDGVYKTQDSLASSYILIVDNKTINDEYCPTQLRIYLTDALNINIQYRYKTNGSWTEWVTEHTLITNEINNAVSTAVAKVETKVISDSNDIIPIFRTDGYYDENGVTTHSTYIRTNELIDVQAGDTLVLKDWVLHTSSDNGPTARVYQNGSFVSLQLIKKSEFTLDLETGFYSAAITATGRLGVNYYKKTVTAGTTPRIEIIGTPVMYHVENTSRHSARFSSVMYNNGNPFGDAPNRFFKDAYKKRMAKNCYPLLIIAGQSNANGACPFDNETTPAWFTAANGHIENYMMWDDVAMKFAPYDIYTNTGCETQGQGYKPDPENPKYSFDPFFVKEYLSHYGGKIFGIRQTVGGIGIEDQPTTGQRPYTWQPDVSKIVSGCIPMVLELLKKVNAAYDYARSNRIDLVPIAVLWHQGEHDATASWAPLYEDNLKNVISWIRGLLAAPCIPWIDGYIIDKNSNTALINASLDAISSDDYYSKTVNMEGHYTHKGDNLHYDGQALDYMGQQMYSLYRELVIGE